VGDPDDVITLDLYVVLEPDRLRGRGSFHRNFKDELLIDLGTMS
jgi:hypothetical protein